MVRNGNRPGKGAAHSVDKSDATELTRQAALTQATNATIAARAILDAALKRGFRIAAAPDGSELVVLAPARLPYETRRWVEV